MNEIENIKKRIAIINEMIQIGEDEISTVKVKNNYLSQKYKELNDAYTELKRYDPDYTPSKN
jgi:hypothetical protein